ncbi:MAG TPA: hypothetical protein VEV85_21060 [Bryobacteraceae bacterium]|nr:hypothetical protein [Bryobacteraceae bacterium]
MKSAFRKISRVGSLTGGTKWYLSEDCLLAAKRMMYAVEYRRFYLRDVESIVVWPSRFWLLRLIIPGLLFAAAGAALWQVNSTVGAILVGMGLAWMLWELALGPTAASRVRTTGASVDLPLAARTRRAHKVLAKIDAAIRAARGGVEQPSAPVSERQSAEPSLETSPETAPATASIADATKTNGS